MSEQLASARAGAAYGVVFDAPKNEREAHQVERKIYTFPTVTEAVEFRDYMIESVGVFACCCAVTLGTISDTDMEVRS